MNPSIDIGYFVVNKTMRLQNEALFEAMKNHLFIKAVFLGQPSEFEAQCLFYFKNHLAGLNVPFEIVDDIPSPSYGYIKGCDRMFVEFFLPNRYCKTFKRYIDEIYPKFTLYEITPQMPYEKYANIMLKNGKYISYDFNSDVQIPEPETNPYEHVEYLYDKIRGRIFRHKPIVNLRLGKYINHGLIDPKGIVAFAKKESYGYERFLLRPFALLMATEFRRYKPWRSTKYLDEWLAGKTPFYYVNLVMRVLHQERWLPSEDREILALCWMDYFRGNHEVGEQKLGELFDDYDPLISQYNWSPIITKVRSIKICKRTKSSRNGMYCFVNRHRLYMIKKWQHLLPYPVNPGGIELKQYERVYLPHIPIFLTGPAYAEDSNIEPNTTMNNNLEMRNTVEANATMNTNVADSNIETIFGKGASISINFIDAFSKLERHNIVSQLDPENHRFPSGKLFGEEGFLVGTGFLTVDQFYAGIEHNGPAEKRKKRQDEERFKKEQNELNERIQSFIFYSMNSSTSEDY